MAYRLAIRHKSINENYSHQMAFWERVSFGALEGNTFYHS